MSFSFIAASATAPTVFPLPPCSQDSSTASQVSIGCLVSGYFPEPVTVQWNSGAISSGIRTFPALLDSSRGLYTLTSQLTIPTSTWESEKFQCNVTHAATGSEITKEIERSIALPPVAPEVRLLHSSCKPRSSDATIELMCVISSFYPKMLTVEWLVGGQAGLLASFTEQPRKDAHGYTFSTTSTVNVSQEDWQAGNTYYCQVFHEETQTKVKSKAKICEDNAECPSSGINVHIIPPTPQDLYVNNDPKLTCVVENLENADGLKVTWSRADSGPVSPELLEVKEERNGRFTATSSLPVTTWLQGEKFTCNVEYPGLTAPITKTIAKTTGTRTPPGVFLYPPHHEEINAQPPMLTLTCLVTGFTPKEVSIQWLRNHNAMPEDHHVNTPVIKDNKNDSYFLYSHMKIPFADWNNGVSHTCMVIHEALPMKFTQRTVEKTQETTVSADADYSDEKKEELDNLWVTIFVFFLLFILSVCYSATVTLFKVKWLFSRMLQLKKQPPGPDYKNVIQRVA
ncbi:Y heavy chain constant region [Podarcis lilfordi]|uniref:Y heavy chain constant region n=1 Tax=Podarcis lilfordi TaxID=74358 RepID=A0AA35L7M6_9SAUR|nr:Y heavy chain constant region [Podarcis lilfordi]